jgi:hypothetical protein
MKKARQPQMNADQKAILGWFLTRVYLRSSVAEI